MVWFRVAQLEALGIVLHRNIPGTFQAAMPSCFVDYQSSLWIFDLSGESGLGGRKR